MSAGELRLYELSDCGDDGYPLAWHESIKHAVREAAGHRCVRCGHPYKKGDGEWSQCDDRCVHGPPFRWHYQGETYERTDTGPDDYAHDHLGFEPFIQALRDRPGCVVEARYRILTVHHLDGDKRNCRWWNLVALCQRCHLQIQGKVVMDRRWHHEHSPWFRPYVAGYYAHVYLGQDLSREQAEERLDELLALEVRQEAFSA